MNNVAFFNSPFDVLISFVVFIVGGLFVATFSKVFVGSKIRVIGLYFWHTMFCLAYAYVTTIMVADATTYYINSLQPLDDFKIGTVAVYYFTAIFTQGIGLSYLGTFLVFNIFGTIGLIAFDAALRQATFDKSKFVKQLALIVILLPSLSFWTGAIGKDSLAFMATGLALWSALDFKRRYLMMFIAVTVMLLVRPHIAGIMIVSLVIAFVLGGGLSIIQKIVFSMVSILGAILIVPIMFSYVGLGEVVSAELIQENIERRQGYNLQGGGSVDISSITFPEKLFSYMFRPLPHEAHSLFAFISSIDNAILLLVFGMFLLSLFKVKYAKYVLFNGGENRLFLIVFSITTLSVLAMTTANMGISVRQKWMFMPMILYFMFLFMHVKLAQKPYESKCMQ